MLPPLFRIELIKESCQANRLILTSNQRLRRKVLQAWGSYRQKNNTQSWPALRIFSLDQWLQSCWQQLQACAYQQSNTMIISSQQEHILWEKVIATDDLMGADSLIKEAAEGLRRLDLWQLSLDDLAFYDTEIESEELTGLALYKKWCLDYRLLLRKQALISREESYQIIARAFIDGTLALEDEIELMGFDDIAPLIQSLLNHASPSIVETRFNQFQPGTLVRVSYQSEDVEMQAAAEWAKAVLTEQPNARIGLIVPNLGQCRDRIERALVNTFEGHSLLLVTPSYTLPFNISAGTPLSQSALMTDTLKLLKLSRQQWLIDDICQLIFSPYWGNSIKEQSQRLRLATRLQSLGQFSVSSNEIRYWAEQTHEDGSEIFAYLQALHQHQSEQQYQQLPSVWVQFFLSYLSLCQWPGERQPNSYEYQQTQLWFQVLEEFTHLDDVMGEIHFQKAITQLEYIMSHTPFQAKVEDSPIQVLGILEGVGLHFSHCWVMGLHQQTWPPAAKPNALLPVSLQQKHNMPHSSSLRELEFARSLTENYCHCAEHIIFSWPEYQAENEQELLVSQLIQHIPIAVDKPHEISDFNAYLNNLLDSQLMKTVDCSLAPEVTEKDVNQHKELLGGSAVLKAQSENPFDAFAIYRLGAQNPLEPTIGFSPIEKGNILHQAVASIWSQLKQQSTLLELSDSELLTIVEASVKQAVNTVRRHKQNHISAKLSQLETKRQTSLILNWLEYEKKRSPFSVIAVEENLTFEYHDTKLKLRIDRVDQLHDGRYLIIDYKSGDSHINAWQDSRLKEPQLPLYLFAYDSISTSQANVAGIAFAQINIKQQTLVGLHDENCVIKELTDISKHKLSLPKDWQNAKEHWQLQLQRLLNDYMKGVCNVDFRDKVVLQNRSSLWPLSRIYDD